MTTHRLRRCIHCQMTYSFQGSGPGCLRDTNDGDYCPICKEVILKALSKVPIARERVWEKVTEEVKVEIIALKERQEQEQVERALAGKLVVTRVAFPLFDSDLKATLSAHPVTQGDHEFLINIWSDDREPSSVCQAMEKNLITGELKPWRNTKH